jgi:surface polysaccharide O-acyltransferase-like enzyme
MYESAGVRSDERSVQLDLARSVATITVVMIHLNDRIFDPIAPMATHEQWVLHAVLNAIGRLAVPIFFMISGSLVIPRADGTHILRFYLKRIPQFVLLLIVYSLATNYVAFRMGYDASFEPRAILSDLLVGHMRDAFHLWFIPALIGVYLAAPFINAMLRANASTLVWYCTLAALLTMLPYTAGAIFTDRPWPIGLAQFFGSYLAYFVAGHLITNAKMTSRVPTLPLMLTAGAAMIGAICVQHHVSPPGQPFRHMVTDYSSLFTAIPSVCAFIVLMRVQVRMPWLRIAIENFSRLSFGVYLIHLAILHFVLRTLERNWPADYRLLLPSLVLIVMTGWAYSFCLSKAGVLRKLVL